MVFVRKDSSDCPGSDGVAGGKRRAALPQAGAVCSVDRPPAVRDSLEHEDHQLAMADGFEAEETGFLEMVVAAEPPGEVGRGGETGEGVGRADLRDTAAPDDLAL